METPRCIMCIIDMHNLTNLKVYKYQIFKSNSAQKYKTTLFLDCNSQYI